jgi:hypothetical protein
VFYGWSPDKEGNQELIEWGNGASEITTCSEEFWKIVEEADLGWVYVREGVGSLQEKGLERCKGIEKVIDINSVGIWKVGHREKGIMEKYYEIIFNMYTY